MRQKIFTLLFAIVAGTSMLFADGVKIGDLYYNLDETSKTAEVTYEKLYAKTNYSSLTEAIIPSSVEYNSVIYNITSIGDGAFLYCSSLTYVNIPNCITNIGGSAFRGCTGLTSITLPSSVTNIGGSAFRGCTGLISITLPSSVTNIGDGAFAYCSSLTSIEIPKSVTSIGKEVFSYCTNLTSVTINSNAITSTTYNTSNSIENIFGVQVTEYIIGDDVTSIGAYAFYGCTGLSSVTISNNVTSIGEEAFGGCENLPVIDNIRYAGTYLIGVADKTLSSYTIKEGTKFIGKRAFSYCDNLTSIVIPSSVTYIGDQAFYDCNKLSTIHFPSSITYVGKELFGILDSDNPWYCNKDNGCWRNQKLYIGKCLYTSNYNCSDWTIEDGTIYICANAFKGCQMSEITIPNSVERIGSEAFYECIYLTNITIGTGLKQIDYQAFGYCRVVRLYITDLEAWCNVTFNNSWSHPFAYSGLYDYSTHIYHNNIEIINLVVPEGVIEIKGAFKHCNNIKTVVLPQTLLTIGDETFYRCSELNQISMPNTLKAIGKHAFFRTAISDIILPDSLESIGDDAFKDCNNLTSLIIPANVTYIGYRAMGLNLKYAIILSPQPAEISTPGDYVGTYFPVYVPTASLSKYMEAKYWDAQHTSQYSWQKYYKSIKPLAAFPCVQNNYPTSYTLKFGYGNEGCYVENCGIVGEPLLEGNTIEYNGLEPNSKYSNLSFLVNTSIGYTDTISYSFTTSNLELATKPSKPVSSTTAILLAETNMSDAETNCGFEYKRYNAPEDMPGTKVYCPVANGTMAGRLKNLKDDVYYKYRAFYESKAGNKYYGEWQYIFTGDIAVEFDPVIYTYAAALVEEDKATLKGYALAGSSDFTEQGFEYWAESRTPKASSAPRYMPAALGEHHTVTASGISMSVTLTELDAGTVYRYRTYAKIGDQILYGSEMTFTTLGEYTPPTYIITFVNWDGAELQSSSVEENALPIYEGETPTKPADAQYTYIFNGWTPEVVIATEDATYTATFTSHKIIPDSLDQVSNDSSQKVSKLLINGQIFILRGDKTFTVTGQEVK